MTLILILTIPLEKKKQEELKEIRESLAIKEKQFEQLFNKNTTTTSSSVSITSNKQTNSKKVNFDLKKPNDEKRSHGFDRKNV